MKKAVKILLLILVCSVSYGQHLVGEKTDIVLQNLPFLTTINDTLHYGDLNGSQMKMLSKKGIVIAECHKVNTMLKYEKILKDLSDNYLMVEIDSSGTYYRHVRLPIIALEEGKIFTFIFEDGL